MLDWIDAFVYRWVNVVDTPVRDVVKWAVHALAGVVYTVFGNVGAAWLNIVAGGENLIRYATEFAQITYGWIRQIVTVDLPWLWHTLASYVTYLQQLAVRLWNDAVTRIAAAVSYLEGLVQAGLRWVVTNVWDPLIAEARQLRADLLKWGYWSWQLLNDPQRLAVILLDALIAAAEAAFWRVAAPAGKFILGVLLHQAGQLAALIETIVAAVL